MLLDVTQAYLTKMDNQLPHYFFTINVFLLPVNLDRCEATRVETARVLFVNLFPSNSFGHRFFTSRF